MAVVHPLRRIRRAFPTIRFLLIVGGSIAFAIAAAKAITPTGAMQNVGWLLLCMTVLFIDPENPPNQTSFSNEEDDNDADGS